MSVRRLHWLTLALCGLATLFVSRRAAAQLAPTGNHYGARASDTGAAAGAPTSLGGYATSLPLSLPPSRGNLPIPLSVVYGGHRLGAAGVGWDVPLYYVRDDISFNHRRPALASNVAPTPRERITVMLPGRSLEMVRKGSGWIGRADGADVTMKRNAGNTWSVFDGAGRTWTFTPDPNLSGSGMWLLDSVTGAGGSKVQLHYAVTPVSLTGAAESATSIDLLSVAYDPHPTTPNCYKYEIDLGYDSTPSTAPLSMTVVGEKVLARVDKILTIDVTSRSTCTAQVKLRSYALKYQTDADTGQEQLLSVKMTGRSDRTDGATPIPIATYSYGTATTQIAGAPVLRYQADAPVALPAGTDATNLSSTVSLSSSVFTPPSPWPNTLASGSLQSLVDMTGDGRADLVLNHNGQPWIARNVGGAAPVLGPTIQPLYDATLTHGALDERSSASARFSTSQVSDTINVDYVWRQTIDMNGDGRLDLVDAAEEPNHWVVYLNTPDSTGTGITWQRRSINVTELYKRFTDRHLAVFGGYVPLSHRYTAHPYKLWRCWHQDSTGHVTSVPFSTSSACGPEPTTPPAALPEMTVVEWELKDINGDGYPDVVLNSSPTQLGSRGAPPDGSLPFPYERGTEDYYPDPIGDPDPSDATKRLPNRVEVAFNVRGLYLANDRVGDDFNSFSQPAIFIASAPCGVARWDDNQGTANDVQLPECDILDVNGDGLADRLAGSVFLGTGSRFTTVSVPLPKDVGLSQQRSTEPMICGDGSHPSYTFRASFETALRDVTGDGIPDIVHLDSAGWTVYIGTGAGFGGRTPIQMLQGYFSLSDEIERCDGSFSKTTTGLFDLDGDGKPEVVSLDPNGTSLDVYRLIGGSTIGTPEAGRLVSISNGYGAATSITYRSAKEDPIMLHQVPFAEIVATAVATSTTAGFGTTPLSTGRYAYGGAIMTYDQWLDAYQLPSYARTVELRFVGAPGESTQPILAPSSAPPQLTRATLTDTYPLAPFDSQALKDARFGRYLETGRVSDVTVLSAGVAVDPWPFLGVNINADARRMGGTHYVYAAREFDEPDQLPTEDVDDFCIDMINAYDFNSVGLGTNAGSFDPCSAHGFAYVQSVDTWRGSAAPPSANNVESRVSVQSVDDHANPLSVLYTNDIYRSDDDFCVDTVYATPTTTDAHVFNAPSSRKVWDCRFDSTHAVYAYETFQYDKLPLYSVSVGLPTGHDVERHATDTGALLTPLHRDWDVSYDAGANPLQIVRVREDGSQRTTTLTYDSFDIAPIISTVAATGASTLSTYFTYDLYSNDLTETRDPNNTLRGTQYDAFGRPTARTVRLLNGIMTATDSTTYLGFDGTAANGRRIVRKQLTDPVTLAALPTAAGRVATTSLDELGRERFTQVSLGADYGNETLVVGQRTYDGLGRVFFEADPYALSQSASPYGTTRYFSVDGTPFLIIRGSGPQAKTALPDPTVERFASAYRHTFATNQESLSVQQADALTSGSPQYGVLRAEISSAIGRVLFRSTWQAGARLEHEEIDQDHVGNMIGVTRYLDPAGATQPVLWTTGYDSFGNLVSLKEPGAAPQSRLYSNWNELKEIDWTPIAPEVSHSLIHRYDALGRLVHAEEQNGGVVDADTLYDYAYDNAASPTTTVTPSYVAGRLTKATAPTGAQYFGYDLYGNVNTRVFTDESAAYYVERSAFHGDGSRASLQLELPDDSWLPERMDYGYDSAGRVRSMLYSASGGTQSVYSATTVDPFGRVRKAAFANTTYLADYADTGRRLFADATMSSTFGARTVAIGGYDPLERELSRSETGRGNTTTASTYDALGRLATSLKGDATTNPPANLANWSYGYDALGNIAGLNDFVGNKGAAISYGTTDRDQICRINYGSAFGLACNVSYDSRGNVANEGTRNGARAITYYNAGGARRIDDTAGGSATMKYDPFGALQELDVAGGGATRSDRRYGAHIARRHQVSGILSDNYTARQYSAPGVLVSRRGAGGPWVISFQEERGVRFSADQTGNWVQDVSYEPYGETTSLGAMPGNPSFSTEQWNGGDALGAIGLVQLGARLYDPVIGRFMSRDPLLVPRTAATTNPYAFAMNDPVDRSDPTGLDTNPPQTQDPDQFSLTDLVFGSGAAAGHPYTPPPPRVYTDQNLVHDVTDYDNPTPSDIVPPKLWWADVALNLIPGKGILEIGEWSTADAAKNYPGLGTTGVLAGQDIANNSGFRLGCAITADVLKLALATGLGRKGVLLGAGADLAGRGVGYLLYLGFRPAPSAAELKIARDTAEYARKYAAIRAARAAQQAAQLRRQGEEDAWQRNLELGRIVNETADALRVEAAQIDDLINARTYGPSCSGDGEAMQLRNEGQGYLLGD